jgi:hypothetical protein
MRGGKLCAPTDQINKSPEVLYVLYPEVVLVCSPLVRRKQVPFLFRVKLDLLLLMTAVDRGRGIGGDGAWFAAGRLLSRGEAPLESRRQPEARQAAARFDRDVGRRRHLLNYCTTSVSCARRITRYCCNRF